MKNHKDEKASLSRATDEKPKRSAAKEEKLAQALRRNLNRRKQATSPHSSSGA